MQYTHDTLGNRTNRVRGILTREMEAVGMSSDTVLQDIIITDNASPAFTDIDYNYHYGLKFTNTWTNGKTTTELYFYGNAFGNTSSSSIEENPLIIVKNKIGYLDFYTFIRK